MKQFACGDVIPGCSAPFAAETNEGILEQVAQHAAQAHGVSAVPPELVDPVVASIRTSSL